MLAGWFVVNALYFREAIEFGFHEGLVPLTVAMTLTSWICAVAASSGLAAAYLRMSSRWLTGMRAAFTVLGLSLLVALPWATIMTSVVIGATSYDWEPYAAWMYFHASMLMAAWSGGFLWFTKAGQSSPTPPQGARDHPCAPDGEQVRGAIAAPGAESSTTSSLAEDTTLPWRADDRLCLQEGRRVVFCSVREIAYVRAAGDYTEVGLSGGQVAIVTQRLRYWESQLPESFVRIHRSTLINLTLTEELVNVDGAWRFRLRGCAEPLTVSRRLEPTVMAKVVGQQGTVSV